MLTLNNYQLSLILYIKDSKRINLRELMDLSNLSKDELLINLDNLILGEFIIGNNGKKLIT